MSDDSLPRKTVRIMQYVATQERGVGLSEIARQTGIPKATCYRILTVLVEERWLVLQPDTRRYRVSLGLVSVLGDALTRGSYSTVRAILEELAAEAEETAGIDTLRPPYIKVLAQVVGPQLIGQSPRPVPRDQSVFTTASGKAALACLSIDEVEEQFFDVYREEHQGNAAPFDMFVDSLAAIRERGYATAVDELETGAAAVASACRTRNGSIYAVWIGGPSFRFTRERMAEFGSMTIKAIDATERSLLAGDLIPD